MTCGRSGQIVHNANHHPDFCLSLQEAAPEAPSCWRSTTHSASQTVSMLPVQLGVCCLDRPATKGPWGHWSAPRAGLGEEASLEGLLLLLKLALFLGAGVLVLLVLRHLRPLAQVTLGPSNNDHAGFLSSIRASLSFLMSTSRHGMHYRAERRSQA